MAIQCWPQAVVITINRQIDLFSRLCITLRRFNYSINKIDLIDKKLVDIEERLIQRKLTGQGQDTVRWPPGLLSKINYLANGVGSSDSGPTNQQREVQTLLHDQLVALQTRLEAAVKTDLANFNKLLRDRGFQNIGSGMP